ncbi:MAG TPA: mechanosensitive ion channel domain-containing protein [Candidatus Bathyarchaeia archaeon]|nr:mechanosensitive ion channel domain-containing protein [Candidatus Bathyarchaeia archaeon]
MALEFLYPIASFAVVIISTWIIAYAFNQILKRTLKRETPLLATNIRRLAWLSIWMVGIVLAIEQLGLRIDFLLLVTGLIGLALIISIKDVIQNFASKYFSDVYVPFKIGDTIEVREHSGKVIEINPISTILITADDQLVSIPNSFLLREITTNMTPQAWKEMIIPIVISNDIDPAEFESEVIKSCNKFRLHLDERFPPILSIKRREESQIEFSLVLMIKEIGMKDKITSEINSRVTEIIDKMKRKKGH